MAWVAPSNKTTSTLITAAIWNQDVVANTTYLGNSHDHYTALGAGDGGALPAIACMVKNSANQSINSGSTTALTFDTDTDDPKAMHDTGANTERIVAVMAGRYLFFGRVQFAGSAAGTVRSLYLNHSSLGQLDLHQISAFSAATYTTLLVMAIVNCALNSYGSLSCYQDTGGPLSANQDRTFFGAMRIGA